MNYYPNNFYGNYPYGNSYPQVSSTVPGAALNSYNQNFLNGKIVDGEEIVKATEVPFGGYGVFPKADLKEIFIKTWTPEGKTKAALAFFPYIDSLQTDIQKESCLDQLSQAFNLKPEAVKRDFLNRNQARERISSRQNQNQTEKSKQINLNAELRGLLKYNYIPSHIGKIECAYDVDPSKIGTMINNAIPKGCFNEYSKIPKI